MAASRLALALEGGLIDLPPSGEILVFRPQAGEDLNVLPKDRVRIIQGFRPDYLHFSSLGFDCSPDEHGRASLAIVFLPRSKQFARALIAQAAEATGGSVVVDGQKTDGVDSILRGMRRAGARIGDAFSKAHGKLFVAEGADLTDWLPEEVVTEDGLATGLGTFSAGAVDPASELLGKTLPEGLAGRVADLGAGWGYLSRQILKRPGVTECRLIEAEWAALQAARQNIGDQRAVFEWADISEVKDGAGLDHVVCNPPFHRGRQADTALGQHFIGKAAKILAPRGTLWLVANRHLPYEDFLRQCFAEVSELAGTPAFKLFRATRVIRATGKRT